jgi:hypothetical protein|tara:strand:+ start:16758 stop:17438 length:681 start_codon:yes stop_codon:yes gene_type:complete
MLGQHPSYKSIDGETSLMTHRGLHKYIYSAHRWKEISDLENKIWGGGFHIKDDNDRDIGISRYCSQEKLKKALHDFKEEALFSNDPFKTARKLYDDICSDENYDSYIEKTPTHAVVSDAMRIMFPDSIFVIVERDLQDATRSAYEKSWANKNYDFVRSMIHTSQSMARRFLSNDDKTVWIRFETLAEDIDKIISQLIELGMPEEGSEKIIKFCERQYNDKRVLRHQ